MLLLHLILKFLILLIQAKIYFSKNTLHILEIILLLKASGALGAENIFHDVNYIPLYNPTLSRHLLYQYESLNIISIEILNHRRISLVYGFDVYKKCYDAGVNIKPTGDALIIAPPFVCEKKDIDEIIDKIRKGISDHLNSR